MEEIFHDGERIVQERVGVVSTADANARLITNTIMKGAIGFIEKQSMAILSSRDINDNIWTSILLGASGFVQVPNPNSLVIDVSKVYSDRDDIFFENIKNNKQLGTLFIELATRRRFRINGEATYNNGNIAVAVIEAYPNCPKYIQQRIIHKPETIQPAIAQKEQGTSLTESLKNWIKGADTFFIGSTSNDGRIDASHRGGKPGFISLLNNTTLRVPDYLGNSLYNTLGNITQNSKAGLLFIDFEQKKTFQLSGEATVLYDQNSEEDLAKSGGTGRFLEFKILEWIVSNEQHTIDWEFTGYSPFNP